MLKRSPISHEDWTHWRAKQRPDLRNSFLCKAFLGHAQQNSCDALREIRVVGTVTAGFRVIDRYLEVTYGLEPGQLAQAYPAPPSSGERPLRALMGRPMQRPGETKEQAVLSNLSRRTP